MPSTSKFACISFFTDISLLLNQLIRGASATGDSNLSFMRCLDNLAFLFLKIFRRNFVRDEKIMTNQSTVALALGASIVLVLILVVVMQKCHVLFTIKDVKTPDYIILLSNDQKPDKHLQKLNVFSGLDC